LYKASESGNLSDAIDALNSDGVDVNERGTDDGETPLTIACFRNHIEIVKILLKRKDLQVNLAMDGGWTALYIAS
jgi:ankyrin repeat protein